MQKAIAVGFLAICIAVGIASYRVGKAVADHYYDAEPEVTCEGCRWIERSAAGTCVKNCDEIPPIWTGNTVSCPDGFDLSADEEAALRGEDSARCTK